MRGNEGGIAAGLLLVALAVLAAGLWVAERSEPYEPSGPDRIEAAFAERCEADGGIPGRSRARVGEPLQARVLEEDAGPEFVRALRRAGIERFELYGCDVAGPVVRLFATRSEAESSRLARAHRGTVCLTGAGLLDSPYAMAAGVCADVDGRLVTRGRA